MPFVKTKALINIKVRASIDLFHSGGLIKYLSVLMLISLSGLAMTGKFQKNFGFRMSAVGLININTKDCKSGRHL